MVRTRHSVGGELDVNDSPKFLSLDYERGKTRMTPKRDGSGGSIHSRSAYEDDDEYNLFEDKVLNSRLRPRVGPGRAYNYLDADSSDDDQSRRRKRSPPTFEVVRSKRSIKKELLEECSRKTRRSSSHDVDGNDHQLRGSMRRSRYQSVGDNEPYRRSTRIKTIMTTADKDDEDSDHEENSKDQEEDDDEDDDDDDDGKENEDSDNGEQDYKFSDMYSRVKRKRMRRQRTIYDPDEENTNNNNRDDSDEEPPSAIRKSRRILRKKTPLIVKSYSLREHKPRTELYRAPVEEPRVKKPATSIFEVTPTKKTGRQPYQSPAQKRKSKKRSAMHSSSSSTSSSSGESSDEKSFRKRKAKSMAKARSRMMPMNFSNSAPLSSIVKDRVKSGASLADVEPMNIDKNITFDSIGGLGKHIRALKEMVVFPLLYDKVFQKFNVDPPRGVLFYGPPGTGKTLVARALANECSHGDKKVAFFMRKGADCLSKWVGESERQLRLLFDQAYKFRPSIIFFDEIDGLAPVRSSRQDQIHSSIVSTLLALMDGLDSRGEIVVIGATNRIDSLDPALRRPGRFDREFLFPLPTLDARKQILKIQTSSWNPKLNDNFIAELAEKCVGYCGADLKALCTEAAMLALRRSYPQIYTSNEALQLDESSISVCAKDFFNAVRNIIPTSTRSVKSPGRPLSLHVLPLLERQMNKALTQLRECFPPCLMKISSLDAPATDKQAQTLNETDMMLDDLESDEDEDAPSIFVTPAGRGNRSHAKRTLEDLTSSGPSGSYLKFTSFSCNQPAMFRPRIILTGNTGQGQTSYIAPALIHQMEDYPVHVLDLPSLYAVTAKTPEESCANIFHEARRKSPSIIYMPYINQWWDVIGDTLRTTLLTLIQDLNPSSPLLLLATSEQPYSCLDIQLQSLFSEPSGEVVKMTNPNPEERKIFFKELMLTHSCKLPPQKKTAGVSCTFNRLRKSRRVFRFPKPKADFELLYKSRKSPPLSKLYRSTHRMTLRSRQHLHGYNNNNDTDDDDGNFANGYTLQLDDNNHFPHQFTKINSYKNSSTPRVKSFRRRALFQRFRQCPRPESNDRDGVNTNFSNNHLTDRQMRYLKRYNLFPAFSGTPLDYLQSRNKQRKCLSSGSVQMLYRGINNACSSRLDSMLPINLGQLGRKRLRTRSLTCNLKHNHKHLLCERPVKHHQSAYYSAQRLLKVLPKAAAVKPHELTKQEMDALMEKEELTLMELRIFLRDVLHKLGSDKKFSIFTKPVNIENAPDYYDVIENPMDMSTMMTRIDCHQYNTVRSFMDDIDLICSNALEYNPDRGPMDRVIRHRACALKDTAYAIIKTELDKDFEKMCVEIEESRKRRGVKSTTVPNFVRTKPIAHNGESSSRPVIPSYLDNNRPVRSIPKPDGERFSRRVRGLQTDPLPSLEDVERTARSSSQISSTSKKEKTETAEGSSQATNMNSENEEVKADSMDEQESSDVLSKPYQSGSQTDPSHKKSYKRKCVWCKPTRKSRKAYLVRLAMRKKTLQMKSNISKLSKEMKIRATPSLTQPLGIEICTSVVSEPELKSPVRKSTRLSSPNTSIGTIMTRRQSLSPSSRICTNNQQKDISKEKSVIPEESNKEKDNNEETSKCGEKEQTGVTELLEQSVENLERLESESHGTKPSVVKSLELDFGAVDSGAGSSLDGNGDSRDSTDNKLGEAQPTTSHVKDSDMNQNNRHETSKSSSLLQNESPKKLIIPSERLNNLLEELVHNSEGYNVDCLQKIYSQLSQIIFRHRHSYDRSNMVTELEKKVTEMTSGPLSLSSFR